MGLFGALLGSLGAILEASWAILGRLEAILGRLEALLGRLGALLDRLGAFGGLLGPSWGSLASGKVTRRDNPRKRLGVLGSLDSGLLLRVIRIVGTARTDPRTLVFFASQHGGGSCISRETTENRSWA